MLTLMMLSPPPILSFPFERDLKPGCTRTMSARYRVVRLDRIVRRAVLRSLSFFSVVGRRTGSLSRAAGGCAQNCTAFLTRVANAPTVTGLGGFGGANDATSTRTALN